MGMDCTLMVVHDDSTDPFIVSQIRLLRRSEAWDKLTRLKAVRINSVRHHVLPGAKTGESFKLRVEEYFLTETPISDPEDRYKGLYSYDSKEVAAALRDFDVVMAKIGHGPVFQGVAAYLDDLSRNMRVVLWWS